MTRTIFGAVVFAQLNCASGKQQDLGRIGWLRGGAQLVSGKYISDALSDCRGVACSTYCFCGMFEGVGRSSWFSVTHRRTHTFCFPQQIPSMFGSLPLYQNSFGRYQTEWVRLVGNWPHPNKGLAVLKQALAASVSMPKVVEVVPFS